MDENEKYRRFELRLAAHQQVMAMTLAYAFRDRDDPQGRMATIRDGMIEQWAEGIAASAPAGIDPKLLQADFEEETRRIFNLASVFVGAMKKPSQPLP